MPTRCATPRASNWSAAGDPLATPPWGQPTNVRAVGKRGDAASLLSSRRRAGRPARLVLDGDSTAEPPHGQLITAIGRPGKGQARGGIDRVRKRLIPAHRAPWPDLPSDLRVVGGVASPGR
jgi:hypothetical protein